MDPSTYLLPSQCLRILIPPGWLSRLGIDLHLHSSIFSSTLKHFAASLWAPWSQHRGATILRLVFRFPFGLDLSRLGLGSTAAFSVMCLLVAEKNEQVPSAACVLTVRGKSEGQCCHQPLERLNRYLIESKRVGGPSRGPAEWSTYSLL